MMELFESVSLTHVARSGNQHADVLVTLTTRNET